MTESFNAALIQRARATETNPEAGPMTLQRAAAMAVARAGQEALKTQLGVLATEQAELPVDELPDLLPDNPLVVGLHSQSKMIGILAMDIRLLTSALQAQTVGKVQDGEVPQRPPTQTDAILCRRFLSTFLAELPVRMDVMDRAPWIHGVQPRDRVAEPRQLLHALADVPLRFLSLTIDIAKGRQTGILALALPAEALSLPEAPEPEPAAPDPNWSNALRERVLDSSAGLSAVLHGFTIPLSDVTRFKTGDMLDIPEGALDRVRLEDASGRLVLEVALGKSDGKWAVQVPDPNEIHRTIDSLGAAPEDPAKKYAEDLEQALAEEAAKPLSEI